MFLENSIYFVSIAGIMAISLLVVLRNRQPLYTLYFLFSILLALFLFCQFFIGRTVDSTFWIQLSFIVTELLTPVFFAFAFAYPNHSTLPKKYWFVLFLPILLLGPLSFSKLLIQSSTFTQGNLTLAPGPLYNVQALVVLLFLAGGLVVLLRRLRHLSYIQRSQVHLLFAAFLIPMVAFSITGIFFVNVGGIQFLRPLSLLATVVIIGYGMISHKLFDIRSFVVRSVAYLLTLTVIALIYVLPTLVLTTFLIRAPLKATTVVVLAFITLAAALLFQPIRDFFNKATNRIFYRDYYDPQAILDRLSALLVGTVDLEKIENGTKAILKTTMRPSKVEFLLIADSAEQDVGLINQLKDYHKDMLLFDDIDQHRQPHLYELLAEKNIAVAAKLKTTHEDLGYILLGFKQSGSIYSDSELRLISTLADEIAVGLQSALRFQEIQRFNVTLQEKVDEATRRLRHANSRLKELDATKDEFISMASHQLRTPLTSIKGYLSMVLEGDVGPLNKKERDMVQTAFDSAERMVFLIADLLNVSRLQSGKFVIENKPTDLAKMVTAMVNQLEETANNHHLKLTYKEPAKFPMLNIDETKIQQVVMNFMDNAIYYTPAGGSIEVVLEATEDEIRYTVTDTGLGVPAAEQHHLFSKFYRAGNARKMRPDGTGLGLFMAKKVIVAQGGAIIFKSTEGKGSTFGFSFPRSKVELKDNAPKPKELAAVA